MTITKQSYGSTPDGQEVTVYTCKNSHGCSLTLMDYGAHVIGVDVPDRNGNFANVTLKYDTLDGYLERHPYFGSTVGRFCNRIALGKFTLNGQEYSLATNNGPNHLHGGERGFDRQVWDAEQIQTDDAVGVKFTLTSPDGDEGYPGNLTATAIYTLSDDNELTMEFSATSDAPTPVNLTNHCYWNLGGEGSGDILGHQLTIHADKYLAIDDTLIPTGALVDVDGTPLDFTSPNSVGARITDISADLGGYDHCYVLRSQDGSLASAATVRDETSGRVMEILTTQPGIQLYTGNGLDGSAGNGGYVKYGGLCLETQHYPDSPNKPGFPTTILKPGETYRQKTVHRFSVE